MIKVYKSKCIHSLSYDKTEFIEGKTYFAYVQNSGIAVIKGEQRRGFCDIEKCMFRHGHPYGFQKYFEVVETLQVQNKKQLRMLDFDSLNE